MFIVFSWRGHVLHLLFSLPWGQISSELLSLSLSLSFALRTLIVFWHTLQVVRIFPCEHVVVSLSRGFKLVL